MRKSVIAVLLALLAACTFNWNDNSTSPTPVVAPTPSPSATPSPVSSVPSDVTSMVILVYGYRCTPGVPEPNHFDAIITSDCTSANITATPKRADGTDAKFHSRSLEWTVTGSGARVEPHEDEPIFNRVVSALIPRVAGSVTLEARLREPNGQVFTASKTVTVAP